MYSEKLKLSKVVRNNGCCYVGVDVDEKSIIDNIDQFCKREDAIGVPVKVVSNLFDEFCEENNIPKISPIIFGKIFRQHFNLTRKSVRRGKEVFYLYADKE